MDVVKYYSVSFPNGNKTFYYIGADDSIKIGDYVLVPFGAFDDITIGYVEDIERFNPMHVPFPLEKMKSILCTVTNPNGI